MKKYKRLLSGALVFAMTTSLATPAAKALAEDTEVKNYLVVMREDAAGAATYSAASYALARTSETEASTEPERGYLVLPMTAAEAAELAQDEQVVSVEEDIIVTAMARKGHGHDHDYDYDYVYDDDIIVNLEDLTKPEAEEEKTYEWNLTAVNATPEDLAAYPTDESQVRVAVLDSGTSVCEDLDVAEYINLVAEEQDIITFDEDGTGHGTAVAGVLAANDDNEGIVGVAPDVTMYSVKVFDYSNTAPISRIIEGIYWAIDNDIHILNMSFGTTVNSYALHQAIQAAEEAGILMVAAAGNSGVVEYPAAYPEVIAVGATDYQGNRAEFSATGATLELMAPGECVLSDSFYGGTMAVSGTSVAAPHVAGAAALLWAKDMTKSSDFIRQLLNASANRRLSTSTGEYGNGLLDVQHAFEIYEEFEAEYVPGVSEYAGIVENTEEYVVGEEPGYVEGLWSDDGHDSSIDQGKEVSPTVYPTKYLTLMKKVSKYVDTNANFKSGPEFANLHSGRNYGSRTERHMDNYVNDLIFLYKVAVALKNMPDADVEKQQEKVSAIAEVMKKNNSVEITDTFVSRTKKLLELSVGKVSGITDQTTAEANAYKILGAALHLAGDVYAHRSVLPRNATDKVVSKEIESAITDNYFNSNHFSNGIACSLSKVAEKAYNRITLAEDSETGNPNAGKSSKACTHRCWECFVVGVENGVVEFRDIRWWADASYADKYEDNANFYKSRCSIGTNYTVKYILKKYKDDIALQNESDIANLDKDIVITLDEEIFLPGKNGYSSYAIRLNALKMMYQEIGFRWEDDWDKYTTTIVR